MQDYPNFADLFMDMDRELKVVLYSDEVTPGREIQGNDRKVQNVYWSLLNFHRALLSDEDYWFTVASLRSSECQRIAGGMTQVYKKILKLWFGRPGADDLRDGVCFKVKGANDPVLFTGRLAMLLHDERAGKEAARYKGASGVKLCLCCRTTCMYTAVVMRGAAEGLLPSTCPDPAKFVLHTTATIAAVVRRLREVALAGNQRLLEELETFHGFNYHPQWLLLDEDLSVDLVSTWCWDWFHCYLAEGVFNVECDALLGELGKRDLGIAKLNTYLQLWTWPRASPSAK